MASISILRRFLHLKQIPFTLSYLPSAQEGFHIFLNTEITCTPCLFMGT